MADEIKAVYCDCVLDASSSMASLLMWVRQYMAVFVNEAGRDFPPGEALRECLYIGFTVFSAKAVDYVTFSGKRFTNDYDAAMSFVNNFEAEEGQSHFQRNVAAALNASITKLKGESGKCAILLFTDAYEAFLDDTEPVGTVDVAALFATEKLSSESKFLRRWERMHQDAASMASETDRPDYRAITWSESMLSSFDAAYAAAGGSLSRDMAHNYPMKQWVQDSAYFRIKQFVSVTYVGDF
ncbi:MAG: hypothetical protein LBC69_02640 [Eubacteriaceae bacterium]|jgi:hypothetical protein|nr:hypothetical protein [Eubacteriaceae bacterium]